MAVGDPSVRHVGRPGRGMVYEVTRHRSGVWSRLAGYRPARAVVDGARDALGIALISAGTATLSITLGLITAGVGCLLWRVRT